MLKQVFNLLKTNIVLIMPLILTGCASTQWFGSKADSETIPQTGPVKINAKVPAQNQLHSGDRVEYRYVPVPVPGQLMAMPSIKQLSPNSKNHIEKGQKAVAKANKKAKVEPYSDQYFNSMLTYVYMPSAVYTIYTSSGKITDIQLEEGEKIINIAASDSANWQIQTSPSGSNKHQTIHILIKPMIAETADNSLIVLTDRRVYHLYLKITGNDTFMISVKWSYPENKNSLFVAKHNALQKTSQSVNDNVIDPSKVRFDYQWGMIQGDRPEWFPVQIFHDSTKTYIKFPEDFTNQTSLPVLYIPDGNGEWSTMSNWRLLNKNTMVIDGVLKEALLETGSVKGKRVSVKIRMVLNGQSR